MIRLMYFSTATLDLSRSDVSQIMASSADRNKSRGITGMLAFNGRNFCQILEGEEPQVTALVDVIRADKRHAGFKVLDQKPIAQRRFDGWAVQYVDALDFSDALQAMDG